METIIEKLFIHTSYYIISALVMSWLWALVRLHGHYKDEMKSRLKLAAPGLVFSLSVVVIIFVSVKPELRVLNDEINLLSVSRSLSSDRKPVVINEAVRYYDKLDVKSTYIDKRPLLFSYFTAILHTVLGYRIANAFIVNFVVLFILLSVICIGLLGYLGRTGVICCVLLIVSHPIVSLTAGSGGFDLFSVTFIVICAAALWVLVSRPSALSFQFMWLSFLMLSNTRYESFVYFLEALVLLAVFGYVRREYFRSVWVYMLTPIFILPLVLQGIITRRDTQVPEGDAMFSIGHFMHNNLAFVQNLFRFDFYLPFANIIIICGIISAAYFAVRYILRFKFGTKKSLRVWGLVVCCLIATNWAIISSYYHPIDDVVTCRFYILPCIAASILFAVLLRAASRLNSRAVWVLLVSVFLFLSYHTVAVENRMYTDRAGYKRNYNIVSDYMDRPGTKNILMITSNPKQLVVGGYGAIGFKRANRNAGLYLRRRRDRLFEDIYVVQEIDYTGMQPRKENRLASAYKLEPVYELQSSTGRFIRISKVVNNR